MRVILIREVERLGSPGDVVNVSDGYARNYLIPRKLAIPATEGNLRMLEEIKRQAERREERLRRRAEEAMERLQSEPLTIVAKAGKSGRLFGSITTEQIAKAINEAFGLEVSRRDIKLPAPIREVGEHGAVVRLYRDIQAEITIRVITPEMASRAGGRETEGAGGG